MERRRWGFRSWRNDMVQRNAAARRLFRRIIAYVGRGSLVSQLSSAGIFDFGQLPDPRPASSLGRRAAWYPLPPARRVGRSDDSDPMLTWRFMFGKLGDYGP